MTLIDLFNAFPLWIKIVIGIPLFFWAVELFLLPFKFNLVHSYYKKKNKEIDVLLVEIKAIHEIALVNNKALSLFIRKIAKTEIEQKVEEYKK